MKNSEEISGFLLP